MLETKVIPGNCAGEKEKSSLTVLYFAVFLGFPLQIYSTFFL